MKKIKIFIIIAALSSMAACKSDFLERQPIDRRTEDSFYKTPQDAFEALTAVYDVLQWDGYGNIILSAEIASDNCFGGGGENDNNLRFWDLFQSATDQNAAAWRKYYYGIYRANVLISRAEGVNWGADLTLKERYIAEAKFLRAYFYFDLVRMFGNIPLVTKPLIPGEYEQAQATPEEVYKQIAEDLKFASEKLAATKYQAGNPNEYGRVTKWAAEALLGRVFLYYTGYYGQNDLAGALTKLEASTYVDDVINNSGYALVDSFPKLWQSSLSKFVGEDNKETVFTIKYTYLGLGNWNKQDGNRFQVMIAARNQAVGPYYNGWGAGTVSPKLWNAFDPTDTRRGSSVVSFEDEKLSYDPVKNNQFQYTGYIWKKFTPMTDMKPSDKGGDFQIDNYYDYPVIRFSDVLLMGAELHLADNLTLSQKYFDLVRDRAFQNATHRKTLSGDAAGKSLLMEERRFELALEGHRYWDLLRQGMTVTKSAIDNSDSNPQFNVSFRAETKGLFQIPQTQISLSNGSLKQNPGW